MWNFRSQSAFVGGIGRAPAACTRAGRMDTTACRRPATRPAGGPTIPGTDARAAAGMATPPLTVAAGMATPPLTVAAGMAAAPQAAAASRAAPAATAGLALRMNLSPAKVVRGSDSSRRGTGTALGQIAGTARSRYGHATSLSVMDVVLAVTGWSRRDGYAAAGMRAGRGTVTGSGPDGDPQDEAQARPA